MFAAAAKAIVERLTALRKDLGTQLEKDVVQASLGALLTAYVAETRVRKVESPTSTAAVRAQLCV